MNGFLVGALIVVAYEFGKWRGRRKARPREVALSQYIDGLTHGQTKDVRFWRDEAAAEVEEKLRRMELSPLPEGENGVELKVWDVPGAEEANLN